MAEHQIVVLPDVRGGETLGALGRPLCPELGRQLGRERDRLPAPFLDLAQHQAAAGPLRAGLACRLAAGRHPRPRAGRRWRRRRGPPSGSPAGRRVPLLGARGDVVAAVPPGEPLELEPDPGQQSPPRGRPTPSAAPAPHPGRSPDRPAGGVAPFPRGSSTARIWARVSDGSSGWPTAGASTRRHGLRATLPRLTSIS